MNYDWLHNEICKLLTRLENDSSAEKFRGKWNFITDIETNDIRPEGKEEAVKLFFELINYVGDYH